MATFIKAVFNLSWPSQLLLLIQFLLIVLVLVVTKKSFKWCNNLPHFATQKLCHIDLLYKQKHASPTVNKNNIKQIIKQRQYQKYESVLGKLCFKRAIKMLFKMYSILQTCFVNLSVNKFQYCILIELWSIMLFYYFSFFTNSNSNEVIVNWQSLLKYCIFMGWNGSAIIGFDCFIQMYTANKLASSQQQTNKNKNKNKNKKIIRILYIYYGAACSLVCLLSILVMNKIISPSQISQLVYESQIKQLAKYMIIIIVLLCAHHANLLVFSIFTYLLLCILPNKTKVLLNIWFYLVSGNDGKSSLNQIKPSEQSLQTFELHMINNNIQSLQQMNSFQEQQINIQKSEIKENTNNNIYNKFKGRRRKSKRRVSTTVPTNLENTGTKQESFKMQKLSVRTCKTKNKYLINVNTLQQMAKQPQSTQIQEQQYKYTTDSLYFEEPSFPNPSIPQTPTFQNKIDIKNNLKNEAKNKVTVSQPVLTNIQNKIKLKPKILQWQKNNVQCKTNQNYHEGESHQIQIINFDGYFIKDLGTVKNLSTTISQITKHDSRRKKLFQDKIQIRKKENYDAKERKFVRKRYQGSNPYIPEVKQQGFTFCVDEVAERQ